MKLSQFTDKFLFKTTIDLGDGEYITLREPTTAEIADFSDDAAKNMKVMEKIFPKCVIESSFTNEEGEPVPGTELYNALKDSGSLFTEIIGTWIQAVPFNNRLNPKK